MKTALIVASALCLCVGACSSRSKSASATKADEKCLAPAEGVASARTINTVCPIGKHGIPANAPVVAYKGNNVGLCCKDCIPGWNAMAEADKDAWVKKTLAAK